MCISRRAPLKKPAVIVRDEEAIIPVLESLKQLTASSSTSTRAASTTSDYTSELNRNDTYSTASLSSAGSSDDASLSDVLGGDDTKSRERFRTSFTRSRSNSAVSWADEHQQPLEEEEPTNDLSPKIFISEEKSALQDKRKHLTSLRQNIFQRLDSMSSLLHEDVTASETSSDETSTTPSNITVLSPQNSSDAPFESQFEPHEMRCLALVAHDHMKPALRNFVETHRELLRKFRLTGPKDTIDMIQSVYDKDTPAIVPCPVMPGYSAEAQLAVQICLHEIGGVVFFMDPLANSNQQQKDAKAIVTMANRHNVLFMPNPTTAVAMSHILRLSLTEGRREMAPSFFENCPSPAIQEYKRRQASTVKDNALAESMVDATLLMSIYSPNKA